MGLKGPKRMTAGVREKKQFLACKSDEFQQYFNWSNPHQIQPIYKPRAALLNDALPIYHSNMQVLDDPSF